MLSGSLSIWRAPSCFLTPGAARVGLAERGQGGQKAAGLRWGLAGEQASGSRVGCTQGPGGVRNPLPPGASPPTAGAGHQVREAQVRQLRLGS